jgi:hypothetical protein
VRGRAILLLLAASCAAHAATFRVDDAATLPAETNATMQWKSPAPGRGASNDVEGRGLITVRLNTAPWLNRNAKIFLVLPPVAIGEVTADWTTQGRLLPGQVRSGYRGLVYAGPIRTPLIEDTILLRITTDGRRLASPQRLDFHFEIDID